MVENPLKKSPLILDLCLTICPDVSYGAQSSHMMFDNEQSGVADSIEETLKRKVVQPMLSPDPKRTKKHPSPPREVLEQLALDAQRMFGPDGIAALTSATGTALSLKDSNKAMKSAKQRTSSREAFSTGQLPRPTKSTLDIAAEPLRSAMRNPSSQDESECAMPPTPNEIPEESTDELQWDDTMYNIGFRRV
jgi:hypothetical protein